MKSREQLYDYCKETNMRTKYWIQLFEDAGMKEIAAWRNSVFGCGDGAYHAKRIKGGYLGPAGELCDILANECGEKVYMDDVRIVADWIFQYIGKKLTARLQKPSHYVVMRINSEGEGLFFIGPKTLPKDILFSDDGIFMTVGYDVLIGFLELSGRCTLPELYRYLTNNGFEMSL